MPSFFLHTETTTDGVLDIQIAKTLAAGTGKIHGIDSSASMISTSQAAVAADASLSEICTFEGM